MEFPGQTAKPFSLKSVLKPVTVTALCVLLAACFGGDDDDPPQSTPTPAPVEVGGGGIKGPLVNALVTVYELDASQADFKGDVIDTGTTNAQAQMTGIEIPASAEPPFLLEFTADEDTTDLVTGRAPVITVMRTVLTESMLSGGEPVYATPLTTMAVDLAIKNADEDAAPWDARDLDSDDDGNADLTVNLGNDAKTVTEFVTALPIAATQVKSTLGFGMGEDIDIFEASPVLDATTTDADEQEQAASYRAAVEAVTAIVYQLNQATGTGDSDAVLDVLTADLADGEIDGEVDGEVSEIYGEGESGADAAQAAVQLLSQDPATLPIPNDPQNRTVGEMKQIVSDERAGMGNVVTVRIDTEEEVELKPAEANPDIDGDGTPNDQDAFPNDPGEQRDFDKDGLGNNADQDDDNDGVSDENDDFPFDPTETTDTDNDGIGNNADTNDDGDSAPDASDDFPLDSTRQNATDQDNDGWPAGQDPDDKINTNPGTTFVDTDGDGLADDGGLTPDSDDDNDGVPDANDAFRTDARYQSDMDGDGVADNDPAETDIDGDGVANTADPFPRNPFETQDTDRDGTGNNTDDDDDGDGVSDALEEQNGTDPLKRDSDGDGVLDNVDEAPLDPAVQFDSDKDGEDNRTDNCPLTYNPDQLDTDGDERGNACDSDDDNDGVSDALDAFPLDADETVDTDGDGIGNNEDTDDDGDSIDDGTDPSPLTPDAATDTDGDQTPDVADTDDDNDGVLDVNDAFPLNADESVDTDGDRIGNNADDDDDNDGLSDNVDPYPLNRDGDGDGRSDTLDNCPTNANSDQKDSDGDKQGDVCDSDDDNDGVPDAEGDNCPLIPNSGQQDADGDDIGDACDTDLDGDTVENRVDNCPVDANTDQTDENGNGIGDVCDADADEDGRIDPLDNCPHVPNSDQLNTDKDALGNACDDDDDNDGLSDTAEGQTQTDPLDADSDDDRVPDGLDAFPLDGTESSDSDEDGVGNNRDNCPLVSNEDQDDFDDDDIGDLCDPDDDNDGVSDANDAFPFEDEESVDTDGDGTGNNADTDDDNDGLSDTEEAQLHTNPLNADTDSDEAEDGADNCPLIANTDQADGDGDDIGDACDMQAADASGFWVTSIAVTDVTSSGALSSLAEECNEEVNDRIATVTLIEQNENAIMLHFGEDDGEGESGTIDGLGAVQFGHLRNENRYNAMSAGVAYSLRETLTFNGSVDSPSEPTVITSSSITETRTFYEGADQSGDVVGSCAITYSGTLTRMTSVAASDLLNPAGTDQGLAFTDSDGYQHKETHAQILEFSYTRIDNSATDDFNWNGSAWVSDVSTRWMMTDNGWEELSETPVVEGTPGATAIVSRGTAGHYGSRWELSAVSGSITGLPQVAFADVDEDWMQAVANPAANFADSSSRAVGINVTSLMDEYEIPCDYNLPKKGLLTCENWLYQSYPEYPAGDDEVTTANLADALPDLLHSTSSTPSSPIGGVGMGRRFDESTEHHVFAWLTGSTLTGAAGTSGDVLFYSFNQTTYEVTLLSDISTTWSISDITGGGELALQFTIPDALMVDEKWYDFDENRHVVIVAAALSDSTPWLRLGYFTSSGTEQQHWGINGTALEELLAGFNYSLPDSDSDNVDDVRDNCPNATNTDQTDTDLDGIGDACEGQTETDYDHDGVLNEDDNCPHVPNQDQADTDLDGIGDACENNTVTIIDTDGDGVIDDQDAFDDEATEQFDTDGDGTGDNSDDCPFTPDSTCADPGVNMDGMYLVNITNITGQELNKSTGSCEDITETTAYFIARITQTGNQIQLVNEGNPSSDFDAGTVDSSGDFVLNGIVTDSVFSGNFNSSTRTLTGSYTETTGTNCEQAGNVTAIPGADVTENTVGGTGVAWFDGWEDASMSQYEYGVVSEAGETGFTYDYDASAWLADSSESEYFLTSSGVTPLDDSYIISGYVSAGETAIINPTEGGVANTSINEHLVLNSVDLNGIPMSMLVRGYESALGETSTFTTGATGYLASIESTSDTYRFWCDDDWNEYVVNTYTCANIVAQSWADQDGDGNSDPVAATDLDQLVSTPSEIANFQAVSGRGIWAGDGYDAAQYQINGYMVSDDGTLAGSNLKMVFVKSYWISNQHFTVAETSVQTPTVGGVQVAEWDVPELVRRLGNQDWEDDSPFLFVESDLDSTPLVRRGNRDLAGRVNYELLFNVTAKDQVLGEFVP